MACTSAQVSASDAWNIAAIEAAEFGDTGSIGRPANEAEWDSNGLNLSALRRAKRAGEVH